VDPVLLTANSPRELFEVSWLRLVRANLLRRYYELKLQRQVAPRLAEQAVIDV
jgi:hypothetical protein